jgi:hypothetical protein
VCGRVRALVPVLERQLAMARDDESDPFRFTECPVGEQFGNSQYPLMGRVNPPPAPAAARSARLFRARRYEEQVSASSLAS